MIESTLINYKRVNIDFYGDPNTALYKSVKDKGTFYEIDLLEAIQSEDKEGVYIDVGANIGNHSIFFSEFCKSTQVMSFEPYDVVYKILIKNTMSYKNIITHNMALSNVNGKVNIIPGPVNRPGMSKIILDGNQKDVDTIDRVISDDSDIAVIKIDVEGHEKNVVLGGLKTIKRCKPILTIELKTNKAFDSVSYILKELGYVSRKRYCMSPTYLFTHKV